MNKKDINLLKKMIDSDNGLFSINKILTAVINNGEVMYQKAGSWIDRPQNETDEILNIIKKTLSGKLGKAITEYQFETKGSETNEMQQFLYELKNSRFNDEDMNSEFVSKIADNVIYEGPYSIFSVNFTITIIDKKSDEQNDLTFIVTAFCPITLRIDGFIYNDVDNLIEKRASNDKILDKASDGFLFPTMADTEQDVNHVMYYTKKANAPTVSIIENLLGCKYVMSAERQKVNFWGITAKLLEKDLTFDMIININEKLSNIVESSKAMSEAREIDCSDMERILRNCGVSDEKLKDLRNLYEKTVGSTHTTFIASNLCDEKVGIKTDNTNINIDYKKASSHLNVQMINGQKCLVIPIDSPDVSVLGIETQI